MIIGRFILSVGLVAGLCAGCAGDGKHPPGYNFTETNELRVSGTPGAPVRASYSSAYGSGVVEKVTQSSPATVFKSPDPKLEADIRKMDPAGTLAVEICRQDHCVFRAVAPSGTQGIRVLPEGLGWRAETY